MRIRAILALPVVLAAAALIPQASAADPGVAALQVGLHARGLYRGPIDGVTGPATEKAIRRLQARARIAVDGVVGPKTRRALGRFARHRLGTRPLRIGKAGWDVASLQFQLAEHGFPSGTFDGVFGPHIDTALRRFQEWAGLKADGVAGSETLGALTAAPATIPLPLDWPLACRSRGGRNGCTAARGSWPWWWSSPSSARRSQRRRIAPAMLPARGRSTPRPSASCVARSGPPTA